MLIPAVISLIISSLILNFNFFPSFSIPRHSPAPKIGQVLGASGSSAENQVLDNTLKRLVEEAKFLSTPGLTQMSGINQPLERLQPKLDHQASLSPAIQSQDANGPPGPKSISNKPLAPASFDLPAENGVILDCQDDNLFFAKRPDRPWPIASITKLFTAYTFLDFNPGWDAPYEIRPEDKREGGKIYLFSGDKVTVKDLFYFSLVGSDNTATAALVRSTGMTENEFVEKINKKIKELGFKNTRIVDPIGLKDGNISTAREVARFAKIALAREDISQASLTKTYKFNTEQGRRKIIVATNELLDNYPDKGISILGGKTGHVDSSGYCLVGQFKNDQGQAIVTVVLGAPSDSSRFTLTKKLVNLYYSNQP